MCCAVDLHISKEIGEWLYSPSVVTTQLMDQEFSKFDKMPYDRPGTCLRSVVSAKYIIGAPRCPLKTLK